LTNKGDGRQENLHIENISFRDIPKGTPWQHGNHLFDEKIRPLVTLLQNGNLNDNQRTELTNYVIIRLVSIMEDFFRALIKRAFDELDLPLSVIIKGNISIRVGLSDEIFSNKNIGTPKKGQILANEFNFAKYEDINKVFTEILNSNLKFKVLGMKFFSAIKKLGWYDPLQIFEVARPMQENWDNFKNIFFPRNEIVHHMVDANLSIDEILSLCDNTLNMMDAASYITMLTQMDEIAEIMQSQKTKREKNKEAEERIRQIEEGRKN
jgi:hypothetical protein